MLCAAVLYRKSNKVQYDVKEMYPVGGLAASCNAQGHIMEIHNTCWDAKDRQPSVAGPVLVEAYVQLNDGPSELVRDPVQQEQCDAKLCDNVDNSRQLSAWAATALPHILEDVGGRDVWVKHSVLSCKVSTVHRFKGVSSVLLNASCPARQPAALSMEAHTVLNQAAGDRRPPA
jgi:hypothetical protein